MSDYFGQSLTFSNELPAVDTSESPGSTNPRPGRKRHPLSGITAHNSRERQSPVKAYHDYSVLPTQALNPRITFVRQQSDDVLKLDQQSRKVTDQTFSNGTSSKKSKTRLGVPKLTSPRLASPYRHSVVSKEGLPPASRTVRQFDARRQRRRLLIECLFHWFITLLLCGLLAACLAGFGRLLFVTLSQKHAFNALITLISIFLGNNLTSSLREFAQMLRWRLLAAKYRNLHEFELVLQCDSLRRVMELLWVARPRGRLLPNKTQLLCAAWLSINMLLQVLVALLGLTYNIDTSYVPEQKFGQISIAELSVIRDIWGAPNPSYYAQLGSANYYGIQGQDYNFVSTPPPGQGSIPSYGPAGTPTIYANEKYTHLTYFFQDQNIDNPDVTLISHRSITASATCISLPILSGGYGNDTNITYLSPASGPTTLNAAHVGPGAMTYISSLNSTCGPRCTSLFALQSANSIPSSIPHPSFFTCNSTLSPVAGIPSYVLPTQSPSLYTMPDTQARIMAGAIGWTGFNYTPNTPYEFVRYTLDSWWSPDAPATAALVAERIMEFAIEGVAAIDYNGPRQNVSGWYPFPAQMVAVQWQWAGAILGVIPLVQLLALGCVVAWANRAVIKDTTALSTARLLRPVVERLEDGGCLLSGREIAGELGDVRVVYGFREGSAEDGIGVRHIDLLEEREGRGLQGRMPEGLYDGEGCGLKRKRKWVGGGRCRKVEGV